MASAVRRKQIEDHETWTRGESGFGEASESEYEEELELEEDEEELELEEEEEEEDEEEFDPMTELEDKSDIAQLTQSARPYSLRNRRCALSTRAGDFPATAALVPAAESVPRLRNWVVRIAERTGHRAKTRAQAAMAPAEVASRADSEEDGACVYGLRAGTAASLVVPADTPGCCALCLYTSKDSDPAQLLAHVTQAHSPLRAVLMKVVSLCRVFADHSLFVCPCILLDTASIHSVRHSSHIDALLIATTY